MAFYDPSSLSMFNKIQFEVRVFFFADMILLLPYYGPNYLFDLELVEFCCHLADRLDVMVPETGTADMTVAILVQLTTGNSH